MRKTQKTHIALVFLFVFASFLSLLTPLSTPIANAADITETQKEQCYSKFNGKDIIISRLNNADATLFNTICMGTAYCQYTGAGTAVDSKRVSCPNPNVNDPAITAQAAQAETAPLVKLVCGDAPTGEAAQSVFQACAVSVRSIYNSCQQYGGGITGGGIVDAETTATCAAPKINQIAGASKVTVDSAKNAIQSGRDEKDQILTAAATANVQKQCEEDGGTWTDGKCNPKEEEAANEAICAGGALGWVLCPISELAIEITQKLADIIENLLVFTPLTASKQGDAIKAIWQIVVNIANILLVIVFLFIIYSQATSMGLSSYGIKKMLPKVIVAAILMNLSFYICAIAVDIANILGQSVKGIIAAGFAALPPPESGELGLYDGSTGIQKIVTSILTVVGGGAILYATGTIALVMPVVVSAAIAMFTAFAVIIFRQVAIVILIILAPLAFVAWVLPNTESWFKKWLTFFRNLLLMFPLIMAIFYGAAFMSNVILLTAKDSSWAEDWVIQLMALAVLVIPLFALPFILKTIGGVAERFGLWTNNKQKGVLDRSRNKANERMKRIRGNNAARLSNIEWGKNHDGTAKTGRTAKFARGAASTAGFVGGYGARRDWKNKQQEANAHRIQEEQIFDRLADTDKQTGEPTARADRYARAAAGAGGEKNAERIRRLALEQKKKELSDEVNRASSAMVTQGAMDSGAYYYEFDKDGNQVAEYADHGRAMTAVARGDSTIGVVKVGEARTADAAKKNTITGNTAEKRYAAMKRMTDIGDGAALGYALYGDKNQGIKALGDDQISDFVQFAGDNAGKIAPKLSHLITNDNGLNGVSGAALAQWHGNEFKVAASRVRQLREQGNTKAADKIQEAVEKAYQTLSTDDNLAQDFKQKHVTAMNDFNEILSGTKARAVMREYGDKLDLNPTGEINDPSGTVAPNVPAVSGNAAARGYHL